MSLRRVAPALLSALICLGAAAWTIRPVFRYGFGRTTACNCADVNLEEWFLSWDAHSVAKGHSPLITHALYVPHAVNLMWNTSLLLPGVLLSPLTRSAGPVATYNALVLIGLAGSAFIATLVLRRWAPWWPAALAGGLLYGFSPYAISAGVVGHLHLILAMIQPLLIATMDDIFIRRRRRAWVLGIQLGLLLTAQLLISEEVLAQFAVIGVLVGSCALISRRGRAWERLQAAVPAILWTALVTAITAGPFLLVQLFGAGTVTSSAQPAAQLDLFPGDLLGFVVPSSNQHFTTAAALRTAQHFDSGYAGEQSTYLGISLLIVILVTVVTLRRVAVVKLHAVIGFIAAVLSLGSTLMVDGRDEGVTLPFALLRHVPLVNSFIAARFSTVVAFSAAVMVAVAGQHLALRWSRRAVPAGDARVRPLGAAVSVVVLAVALIPLTPLTPLPNTIVDVPDYFTSAAVARGTAYLYPYPSTSSDQAMVWQSYADFSFAMAGGYAVLPGPGGAGSFEPDPSALENQLVSLHAGTLTSLPTTNEDVGSDRAELCRRGIDDLIVVANEPGAAQAASLFTALARRGPDVVHGGVSAWNGVTFC